MLSQSILVLFVLLSNLCLINTAQGANKIPDFQTTRLKSLGGTGVASILMDEATILNPSTLSFFNISSFYLQRSGQEIEGTGTNIAEYPKESTNYGVIASDSKGQLKSSFSYLKQKHRLNERKRISVAGSKNMGKRSSAGFTYRKSSDHIYQNGELVKDSYHQSTFGFSHVINSSVMMGIVINDPFKVKEEDTNAIIGFQYVYQDLVSFMLDVGADYNKNLSDTLLYRLGSQLKVYNNFFLRFGTFNNKQTFSRGTGVGIGWLQPRLSFDLALTNTKYIENLKKEILGENIKETSFSFSYRF